MATFYLFSRSYMPKKSYLCGANINPARTCCFSIQKHFSACLTCTVLALELQNPTTNKLQNHYQMKKILLTLLCALSCFFAVAQSERTYNETYIVTRDGGATFMEPQNVVVNVIENGDGTANFLIKDVVIKSGENNIPIGDLAFNNIELTPFVDGLTYFSYSDVMSEGFFENITYDFTGKMNDEKIFAAVEFEMGNDEYLDIIIGSNDFEQPGADGKVYTEPLVVTINGESTEPQDASVTVMSNSDGTINFVLQNFCLAMGDNSLPVGNIRIDNLPVTKGEDGLKHISYDGPLTIQPGNMEGVGESEWLGPMLGEIPLKLEGKMSGRKLFVTIDIDMQAILGQIIYVQLGTDDFPTITSKVYTDNIIVSIDEETSDPQEASVLIEDNGDGTVNFELVNFILGDVPFALPIGNIRVEDLTAVEGEDGMRHISYAGPITIQPGNVEGVEEWYGPMLGQIPVSLTGKMDDEKLIVSININFMSQIVTVQFGGDLPPVGVVGDANGDGVVDVADATFILNVMADEAFEPQADVNGDNTVDVADYTFVLNLMADAE